MLTINAIIHGVMKISYFSQSFIHGEFIISLLPLESGFVSSIQDSGSHGSLLVGSNNTARDVCRTLSNV